MLKNSYLLVSHRCCSDLIILQNQRDFSKTLRGFTYLGWNLTRTRSCDGDHIQPCDQWKSLSDAFRSGNRAVRLARWAP